MTADSQAEDCPFCAIIAGRLPSSQVYADEHVIAFLDIRPLTTGHLLVVPRRHAAGLAELDEQAGARMFTAAQRLAKALRESGLPCQGVNLFLADGAVAGQEVAHAHIHVLPRTEDDGFTITARRLQPDRADLDQAAALISRAVS